MDSAMNDDNELEALDDPYPKLEAGRDTLAAKQPERPPTGGVPTAPEQLAQARQLVDDLTDALANLPERTLARVREQVQTDLARAREQLRALEEPPPQPVTEPSPMVEQPTAVTAAMDSAMNDDNELEALDDPYPKTAEEWTKWVQKYRDSIEKDLHNKLCDSCDYEPATLYESEKGDGKEIFLCEQCAESIAKRLEEIQSNKKIETQTGDHMLENS